MSVYCARDVHCKCAAHRGQAEAVMLLLAAGADMNAQVSVANVCVLCT
jgi:hypothetical protein